MKSGEFRYVILAALAFAVVTLVGLWTWNTAIELFGGPHLEYRHAVAIFAMPALIRVLLLPGRGWHRLARCKHDVKSEVSA